MLATFKNGEVEIHFSEDDVTDFEYVALCMECIEKHTTINNDAIGTRAVPRLLRAAVERFGPKVKE